MKKLLYLSLAVLLTVCFVSCKKDKVEGLKWVDDVCSVMDNETLISYCLSHFDANNDCKIITK